MRSENREDLSTRRPPEEIVLVAFSMLNDIYGRAKIREQDRLRRWATEGATSLSSQGRLIPI